MLPPWKLTGGTKTLWYARTQALREIEIKHDDQQRRDAAMRQKK